LTATSGSAIAEHVRVSDQTAYGWREKLAQLVDSTS
jgi:hypothetical protein